MSAIYARVVNYYDISKLKDITENFLIPSFANPFSFFFKTFVSLSNYKRYRKKLVHIFSSIYTEYTSIFNTEMNRSTF